MASSSCFICALNAGWGDVQPGGRTRDAPRFDHGDEVANASNVHRAASCQLSPITIALAENSIVPDIARLCMIWLDRHADAPLPETSMIDLRATARCCLVALCVIGASGARAREESFPARPIHLVVFVAPGGSADAVGRMLGEGLARRLGQAVIVENRPGAGGESGDAVRRPVGTRWLHAASHCEQSHRESIVVCQRRIRHP